MPVRRPWSTTSTEPTECSFICRAASSTDIVGGAVTVFRLAMTLPMARWGMAFSGRLLPEVDGFAARPQALGARLAEAPERRLVAVRAARHVLERRGDVERPQVRVHAKHLASPRVEKDYRGRIRDAQVAR